MNKLKLAVLVGVTLIVAAPLAAWGVFAYVTSSLPEIRALADYRPPETTHIYSDDGELVGQLYVERRTVVPYASIPKHVIDAFLAAEDANFWTHEGLDYVGILRAALKNLRPGAHLQGASTITQQTVKTLVVGGERSYLRKLKEAILARELEQTFSKQHILYLYLNQIYFGSGAHGIEEAARTYFGKSVRELDLGEATLLASVPKNPSRYTPRADPQAAKVRQRYVLEQMLAQGWVTQAQVDAAIAAPIPPAPTKHPYRGKAPHYVELVRRFLLEHVGERETMEGGLEVYTGMSAAAQAAAHDAVRRGLEDLTRQQGFAGAPLRLEPNQLQRLTPVMHAELDRRYDDLVADEGAELARAGPGGRPFARSDLLWDLSRLTPELLGDDAGVAKAMRTARLADGVRVTALVTKVDPVADVVTLDLGGSQAKIPFAKLAWARRFSATSATPTPREPTEVLRVGELVQIEVPNVPVRLASDKSELVLDAELVPRPRAEAALVAIDPYTRHVRALVGGYDLEPGNLIRATQAKRQPGSAFKPIVYAAGLLTKTITPASTCADSPVVIHDPWTGKPWKPANFEDGKFDGNITYRTALVRSKNTCSVKLVEKVGPEAVIQLAGALGIESKLPANLTIALGSGDVTPLELANAYASLAAGGVRAAPILVRKVVDRRGTVRFETRAEPEEVLSPAVAYVITQMMRYVVEEGTATKALVLDRPLAGKTGTSNEARNVWFGGYSPELAAVVWAGFDDNAPMGRATGGGTALPIWIRFMGRALDGVPRRDFQAPPEVTFVKVDADTGRPSSDIGSIEEAFIAGTEPNDLTQPLDSIFLEDDDKRAGR